MSSETLIPINQRLVVERLLHFPQPVLEAVDEVDQAVIALSFASWNVAAVST